MGYVLRKKQATWGKTLGYFRNTQTIIYQCFFNLHDCTFKNAIAVKNAQVLLNNFSIINNYLAKQHVIRSSCPEVFCKKDVLRNFAKFTGKHLYQNSFLIKLQPRCFPVNSAKFLRTPFFKKHLRWLLLYPAAQ